MSANNHKCEGVCADYHECEGEVRYTKVTDPNDKRVWYFWYCDEARETDRRRGFRVHITKRQDESLEENDEDETD